MNYLYQGDGGRDVAKLHLDKLLFLKLCMAVPCYDVHFHGSIGSRQLFEESVYNTWNMPVFVVRSDEVFQMSEIFLDEPIILAFINATISCSADFSLPFPLKLEIPFQVGNPLVSRGARVQSPLESPMATMPCAGASLAVRPNGIMALTRGRGHWDEEMVRWERLGGEGEIGRAHV